MSHGADLEMPNQWSNLIKSFLSEDYFNVWSHTSFQQRVDAIT